MDKNEALAVIRKNYPHVASSGSYFETALRELIPDLQESKDERIKKDIIALIEFGLEEGSAVAPGSHTTKEEALDWLEKQKEYPTNEEMLRTLRAEYEKGVADTIAKYEQKEQKPAEPCDDLCCGDDRFKIIGEAKKDIIEKTNIAENEFSMELPLLDGILTRVWQVGWLNKKQKPAEWSEDWREEDIQTRFAFYTYKDDPSVLYLSNVFVEETSRNHGFGTRILRAAEKVAEAIGATTISLKVKQNSPANAWYRKNGYGYVAFEDGYDWLEKNLEYMKPNKQEWSEEDENMRGTCIYLLEHGEVIGPWKDCIAWLKSLRPPQYCENCKLKRSVENWKPSKEQMDALRVTLKYMPDTFKPRCTLMTLQNDLKKLM